jgi:membrane protease YdiL (CAAX protease family)
LKAPLSRIAIISAGFEGGLGLLAAAGAWLLSISLAEQIVWRWSDVFMGAMAALPVLALAILGIRVPWKPLQRLRAVVEELIVPLFRGCSLFDFLLISLAAGIGEELLFRGLIQTWLSSWLGVAVGLALASLVFGLFHPITATYVALATAMGAWLGWLSLATGNLLTAIVCHAVYDFLALVYLERAAGSQPADAAGAGESPTAD